MWKKNMRSYQSLIYRKKYKCPICNEYSLHIIHDFACKCKNECNMDYYHHLEIDSIILENDFKGYYTLEELESLFYKIYTELKDKRFMKITDDPLLKGMSNKQKNEIENLFAKTIDIDSQLDDVVVKYINKYNIKEFEELTPFSYVINLVEDIHHFLNLAWHDICLFYYGSNLVGKKFYTERFFFDNCVDHIALATERIYVFLGIYYDYNFDNNLSNNRTINIKKYLKKNSSFKGSKIKNLIDLAASFSIIKEIRGYNIHDLSFINNKIIEDIKKNPKKKDYYNADSTDINKLELKPKLPKLLETIKQYYDVLFEIIKMIACNDFNQKNIPMLKIFWNDIVDSEQVRVKYSIDFCNNLNKKLSYIFQHKYWLSDKYTTDVFFRINDIIHCITDIFHIATGKYYIRYNVNIKFNRFILQVDEQYLLYSAVIRLYSCYDKLSKYLAGVSKEYQNIQYFSDFNSYIFHKNDDYDEEIKNIINNPYFQKLERLRNNIYHSLSPGCLGGKEAIQSFNIIIAQAVFENVKLVLNFLDFIIIKNKNI